VTTAPTSNEDEAHQLGAIEAASAPHHNAATAGITADHWSSLLK
jgi:hypothetical protein